jgi:hypothetical protein
MLTASSASLTWRASLSASEYTATVLMPILRAVAMTRQAISPRLAIRILVNISNFLAMCGVRALALSGVVWVSATSRLSPQRTRCVRLRSCPPPCGLLLDFAATDTPCPLLRREDLLQDGGAPQHPGMGCAGRFAQVKEERAARGTRSKTPGTTRFLREHQTRRAMTKLREECSRACARGFPASCPSASPANGRCACGFRAAGSRRR